MDHFGAVTSATQEELQAVSDMAMEMGRTTVFSAIEAAGAMVELGKAGFVTSEILGGIGPAVASLAAAGDFPLTEATEVLANVLRTFNLEAKDAVYVADQLAGAANASTIEVKDLAVSLKYAGGVASSLNIPLHDVADALAILGNNGIRGSTAGTTLRRILLELNPATKKQVETLRELGIIQDVANVSTEQLAAQQQKVVAANNGVTAAQEKVNSLTKQYADLGAPKTAQEAAKRTQELSAATEELADAQELATRLQEAHKLGLQATTNEFFHQNGQAKSLGEIFQIVEDRTKHLNAAEKQRVLDIIFGSRAIAGALILAREGADGFAAISAQIEKVSAAEVAAKRLDNLAGSLKRLKNILITEMVAAATPLLASLQSIVEFVTRAVTAFGGLPAPMRQATLIGLALFGAFAVMGGGLLLLVSFIARGVRAFKELGGMFRATNAAKLPLEKNVPILAGRLGFLGKAAGLLLAPFKLIIFLFKAVVVGIAGFLGISVGAVVLIGLLIAAFVLLLVKVKPVRDFFVNIGKAIADFASKIPGALSTAAGAVGNFLSGIGGRIADVASSIGGFFSRLPGIIGGALSTAASAVGNFLVTVGAFLMTLPGIVGRALLAALESTANFVAEVPNHIAYGLGFLLGFILRLGIMLVQGILSFSTTVGTAIIEFFVGLWNTAVEWGPKIFNAVIEWFMLLPGRIVSFLDQTWESFNDWADRTWDRAWQLGSDVLAAITEWFILLPGRVVSFLDRTWEGFASWADRTWDRAWQLGSDVLSAIGEWFSQLPGRIGGFLNDAWNRLSQWSSDMQREAYQAGVGVFRGIYDGIRGLPGTVGGVLQAVINAFLGVVRQAWNAAKSLASSLWNGFKAGLGISSPSFIERATWAMVDNVGDSITDLKRQIGTIRKLALQVAQPMSLNTTSPEVMRALRSQVDAITFQAQGVAQEAKNVFHNTFNTQADPQQISSEIMWQVRVR